MTISKQQLFDRLGLILWFGSFLIIMVMVWVSPNTRSVVGVYRNGSEAFVNLQPLYHVEMAMGYLYAPAFAALYVPLLKLGPYVGDTLWRLLCFGVLTLAAVRQVRKIGGTNQVWLLSFGLFLALPIALGAIRNGQSTVLMTGACWLLTFSALEGRRAETFLWATLAILAKPTAIIMLLLAGALRPRSIPVLVLSVLFVLVVPYVFAPAAYVSEQYRDFFHMLTSMAVDPTGPFVATDFTAPFATLGFPIPEFEATIVRTVAGLLVLGAVLWFDRKLEPNLGSLAIFLTAAFYMCVFNPRVEPNTYVTIAVPAGLSIALLWSEKGEGVLRWVLAILIFITGLTGIDRHVHEFFHPWHRSISATIFGCVLIGWFLAKTRAGEKLPNTGSVPHG